MKEMVLVTGATGFIGRHCARELSDQGYRTIGMDIISFPGASQWGLSSFTCGRVCVDELEKLVKKHGLPSYVVHCAGSGSVPVSFENPRADFVSNVVTTMEVLEFSRCHESRVGVIIPSSVAVYGFAKALRLRENGPTHPVSPYGIHKRMTEELALSYSKNFGVPSSVIRFFSVYGAGLRKQLLWDACSKAESRNYVFAGHGTEVRDFIHVTDAARLLVIAMEKVSPSCSLVNGGTGKGTSIDELLTMIGDCWNPTLRPAFTGKSRQGDPTHYIADVTRLHSWGFESRMEMGEAVKEYVAWYKAVTASD
jgi:UDP-glucose 4-epimerase